MSQKQTVYQASVKGCCIRCWTYPASIIWNSYILISNRAIYFKMAIFMNHDSPNSTLKCIWTYIKELKGMTLFPNTEGGCWNEIKKAIQFAFEESDNGGMAQCGIAKARFFYTSALFSPINVEQQGSLHCLAGLQQLNPVDQLKVQRYKKELSSL